MSLRVCELKKHVCDVCHKGFTQKSSLKTHALIHTGEKPYACFVCDRTFTDKSTLRRHSLIHTGEKPHVCDICNKAFFQKISLKKHYLTHTGEKNHVCEYCRKGFSTKYALSTHYLVHIARWGVKIRRNKCEDTSALLLHQGIHKNTAKIEQMGPYVEKEQPSETEEPPVTDLIDQQPSIDTEQSNTTLIKDLDVKAQSAIQVPPSIFLEDLESMDPPLRQRVKQALAQIEHKVLARNRQETFIIINPKNFATNDQLIVVEGVSPCTSEVGPQKDNLKNGKDCRRKKKKAGNEDHPAAFACDLCPKKFEQKLDFQIHYCTHSTKKEFSCDLCGKKFPLKKDLQKHYGSEHPNHRPFSCIICHKKFKLKGALYTHSLIHTGEKPHSCSYCSRRFTDKSTLIRHELIHTGQKNHACHVCKRRFVQKSTLVKHLLTHSSERSFQCRICPKRFKQKHSLDMHYRFHKQTNGLACGVCQDVFMNKVELEKHYRTHTGEKPHTCHVCHKGFEKKAKLNRHMLGHTGERPFACNICQKAYKDKCNLYRHYVTHKGVTLFKCDQCEKSYLAQADLDRHYLAHKGDKPHSCEICHEAFDLKAKLKRHMLGHTGHRPYVCDVCQKGYKDKCNLQRHYITHFEQESLDFAITPSGQQNGNAVETVQHENRTVKPHVCQACEKTFETKLMLNQHVSDDHTQGLNLSSVIYEDMFEEESDIDDDFSTRVSESGRVTEAVLNDPSVYVSENDTLPQTEAGNPGEIITNGKKHACGNCQQNLEDQINHTCSHAVKRPFFCGICKKDFKDECSMFKHDALCHSHENKIKIEVESGNESHPDPQLHLCCVCMKGFVKKAMLNRHMLGHTGERPYVCDMCGKGFEDKCNLRRHYLSHFADKNIKGEKIRKTHTCHVCSKVFGKKAFLTRHMLSHTGERPFVCNICNKGFKDKCNLRRHYLVHVEDLESADTVPDKDHPDENGKIGRNGKVRVVDYSPAKAKENSYVCNVCDKGFKDKRNLRLHCLEHAGENIFEIFENT